MESNKGNLIEDYKRILQENKNLKNEIKDLKDTVEYYKEQNLLIIVNKSKLQNSSSFTKQNINCPNNNLEINDLNIESKLEELVKCVVKDVVICKGDIVNNALDYICRKTGYNRTNLYNLYFNKVKLKPSTEEIKILSRLFSKGIDSFEKTNHLGIDKSEEPIIKTKNRQLSKER